MVAPPPVVRFCVYARPVPDECTLAKAAGVDCLVTEERLTAGGRWLARILNIRRDRLRVPRVGGIIGVPRRGVNRGGLSKVGCQRTCLEGRQECLQIRARD